MKKPLLSIVVPTKNRYHTLLVLIESLLEWDVDNFEIVVQDNSEDSRFYLENIGEFQQDERLKYSYVQKPLTAIENCDLAISKATGKFVCFIGDDDGVVPKILEACKWMENKSIDALYCHKASYTWPDMQHAYAINNKLNSLLRNISNEGNSFEIDIEAELAKIMRSGGQSLFNMPRLYHGIVAKKVLDEMYDNLGSYFPGSVPDMANAVGMAPYIKKACYLNLSLVISGHSKSSMSGRNAVKKHQGELSKEKTLPRDVLDTWNNRIPKFWSAPTIWADAAFRSNIDISFKKYSELFNFSKMYANCFAFTDTKYWKEVRTAMNSGISLGGVFYQYFMSFFYFLIITFTRVKIYAMKVIFGVKGTICRDIKEAINFTEKRVEAIRLPD